MDAFFEYGRDLVRTMNYELWAFIIALLSFFVAGIALGWNIFRDFIDRPKLKIRMWIANYVDSVRGEMPQVVSVTVTNKGKKPIMIKAHGFHMKDKTSFILRNEMHLFRGKRLEPYDFLDLTLPHETLLALIEKADQMKAFVVYDSTGKEWKVGKRNFKKFKKSLQAKKTSLVL